MRFSYLIEVNMTLANFTIDFICVNHKHSSTSIESFVSCAEKVNPELVADIFNQSGLLGDGDHAKLRGAFD